MLIKSSSKTSSKYSLNAAYCPYCGHKENGFCHCNECTKKRQIDAENREIERLRIFQEKRRLIEESYNINLYPPVNISDLTFRDRVYLGALLRTSLSEDMKSILPLKDAERKLSPTSEYTKELLRRLHHNNIIRVSPNSSIDAFPDSDAEIQFPNSYYIDRVTYIVNINFISDPQNELASLMNPIELSENDKDEAFKIWKEIALEECLEYFNYQMNNVRFDFTVGKKTIATFKDMLDNFSVSQIYGIIYRSVANATKYYQESNISRKQAANSVIGGCQRYSEKALLEKWDLKKFNRSYDVPQSAISEFLKNRYTRQCHQ